MMAVEWVESRAGLDALSLGEAVGMPQVLKSSHLVVCLILHQQYNSTLHAQGSVQSHSQFDCFFPQPGLLVGFLQ